MVRPKSTGQDSQSQLEMGHVGPGHGAYGIVDFIRRHEGLVVPQQGMYSRDGSNVTSSLARSVDECLQSVRKIVMSTCTWSPEEQLTGLCRSGVPPKKMVPTHQAEECLIWKPRQQLILREKAVEGAHFRNLPGLLWAG